MAAAELHLLGQLTGASGFPLSSLFCKFSIESGSNFRVLQGVVEGQTQCDQPNVGSLTRPSSARARAPTDARHCCVAGGGDGRVVASDRRALNAQRDRWVAAAQA
jgi:hypothetical protein